MIKKYGNVRKRTKKNIDGSSHIKVYRNGVRTSKRYTFFNVEFSVLLDFIAVTLQQIFEENLSTAVPYTAELLLRFIASCRAVLRALFFAYSTLFSSAL